MIDLHCHLLPGIDDGPATTEDAVALARALLAAGITRVAATPHVSPDYPNTAGTVRAAWEALVDELARAQVPLEVVSGAEVDLLQVVSLDDADVQGLTLGRDGALLVECPFASVVPQFETLVVRLQERGFRVVLAHPERSPAFLREPELLRRLVRRGALGSLTGASFAGRFGRTARRYACWAIDEGLAHDVATDAHDVARRAPLLRAPLEEAGYGWAADWLTDEVPAAVLAGGPLPARPKARATAGAWWRLRRVLPATRP
ncbi:MAG TPA: CpsB/CapC family capsule biosynthesis tyrosine phosphatase [Baekduia sp.]|nr:CpsB/CapC family capsule biosynthesis tyrosine phosphatase [Baekduia sp.]